MKKILLFIVVIILSVHCTKFDEIFVSPELATEDLVQTVEDTTALINPYSLATAQAALNEITDEVGMDRIKFKSNRLIRPFLAERF